MTGTSGFNFSSGPNPDLAHQWDSKRKLISLVEVCALPSALLVTSATEGGGYVFTPFCLSVCLSVYRISQKVVDRLGV